MRKIPTMFRRDPDSMKYVLPEVHPACQWVLDGEGEATAKLDGTCMMYDDDACWWARREIKPGKTPPADWEEADSDPITGKRVGWEPIEQSPFVKMHREALTEGWQGRRRVGTYELIGPKINGNPHGLKLHELHMHGDILLPTVPRDFDGIRNYLRAQPLSGHRDYIEGIVFHHEDGRRAKIKVRDFPAEHPS